MLKNLKFPLIYLIEIMLWLPLISGFYLSTLFIGAKPLNVLNLHGKSLPATWEAAVTNHGKFLQGYLISNHPFMFALSLTLWLGSAFLLYKVHRKIELQCKELGPEYATRHKIANTTVFIIVGAFGFFLITHVLIGIEPI